MLVNGSFWVTKSELPLLTQFICAIFCEDGQLEYYFTKPNRVNVLCALKCEIDVILSLESSFDEFTMVRNRIVLMNKPLMKYTLYPVQVPYGEAEVTEWQQEEFIRENFIILDAVNTKHHCHLSLTWPDIVFSSHLDFIKPNKWKSALPQGTEIYNLPQVKETIPRELKLLLIECQKVGIQNSLFLSNL